MKKPSTLFMLIVFLIPTLFSSFVTVGTVNANNSIKILILGTAVNESFNSASLTNDLEGLLKTKYAVVEVDYQKTNDVGLMYSYYMPKHKNTTKSLIKSKNYDYVIINDGTAFDYDLQKEVAFSKQIPEYHYIGVSKIAQLARDNGSVPMLLIQPRDNIENAYRVANGTKSIPIPYFATVTNEIYSAKEHSYLIASCIYAEIVKEDTGNTGFSSGNTSLIRGKNTR
jgi:hypothetical protein